MSRNYDIDELLAFAQRDDYSAAKAIDFFGLSITERQVQRIVASRLGRRPTRPSISKPNVLREVVVNLLEAQGKNPRHCSNCGKVQVRGGAIRSLDASRSLDSLVFVCLDCAAAGDV